MRTPPRGKPAAGHGRYRTLAQTLADLRHITDGCRADMHEPDEQDLTAVVTGMVLDNAGWTEREIMVRLSRDGYYQSFNLADLIALARKAVL
jgi:hypothetical protein